MEAPGTLRLILEKKITKKLEAFYVILQTWMFFGKLPLAQNQHSILQLKASKYDKAQSLVTPLKFTSQKKIDH